MIDHRAGHGSGVNTTTTLSCLRAIEACASSGRVWMSGRAQGARHCGCALGMEAGVSTLTLRVSAQPATTSLNGVEIRAVHAAAIRIRSFDLVVANLAEVLVDLADDLGHLCRDLAVAGVPRPRRHGCCGARPDASCLAADRGRLVSHEVCWETFPDPAVPSPGEMVALDGHLASSPSGHDCARGGC